MSFIGGILTSLASSVIGNAFSADSKEKNPDGSPVSKGNPVLGSAISKVGSTLSSSAIESAHNKREEERKYARELEKWRMENEYNHPKEIVKRLEEAGLNPALAYGSAPTGNAGSIGETNATPFSGDQLDLMGTYAKSVELRNIESETLLNEAEAKRIAGETLSPGFRESYMSAQRDLFTSEKLSTDLKREMADFQFKLDKEYAPQERKQAFETMKEQYNYLCARTIAEMNKNSVFGIERQRMENELKLQGAELVLKYAQASLFVIERQLGAQQFEHLQKTLPYIVEQVFNDTVISYQNRKRSAIAVNSDRLQLQQLNFAVDKLGLTFWTDYLLSLDDSLTAGIQTGASLGMSAASLGVRVPVPHRPIGFKHY